LHFGDKQTDKRTNTQSRYRELRLNNFTEKALLCGLPLSRIRPTRYTRRLSVTCSPLTWKLKTIQCSTSEERLSTSGIA